jgi:hypothetical protein
LSAARRASDIGMTYTYMGVCKQNRKLSSLEKRHYRGLMIARIFSLVYIRRLGCLECARGHTNAITSHAAQLHYNIFMNRAFIL